MDPEYTFSVPKLQTASGGFDMLSHIMEIYFSEPDENNVSDDIAEAVMKSVIRDLPAALKDPADYTARHTAATPAPAGALDVAPTTINDRTMLPIRFIAESFKFSVEWDGDTQTVTITVPSDAAAEAPNTDAAPKSLVVYFSATNTTEGVAQKIADYTGADLFELTPKEPYTDDNLDWTDDNSRVVREHNDPDNTEEGSKIIDVPTPKTGASSTITENYVGSILKNTIC